MTGCTARRYDQFETSPKAIEQELRPAVCERRQTDRLKAHYSIDDVRTSIASLKPGKTDGRDGVLTDHNMHGGHNLHVHVCQLFNSMLIHGMSPSSLQSSTLAPIPKDKRKSLSLSDNYRAIALSSTICKVLDTVILRKYGDLLSTCDLQNGFKEHGSTNTCTFMVKETIKTVIK